VTPRRRLRDYYRQFEELSPQEASERLRARREQEKSLELARVGELDCAGPEWHEPPDPEVVNAATFALRRAAGHEQREGMLARIFAVTAVVAGLAFLVWFIVLEGPAPTMAPQ